MKPKKKKNQNEKNERKRLRLQDDVCDKAPTFYIKAVKQYLEKAAEIQKRYEPTPQGVLVCGSGDCVSKIIFICFV